MNNEIFIDSIFNEKIKVPSKYISKGKDNFIFNNLKKLENKCSKNGYIKKNSIKIISISMGIIEHVSLQGSVIYNVKYKALICNPVIGSIITTKIENINQFGLLCTVKNNDNLTNIIEIIVPKKSLKITSDVDLDKQIIGNIVSIKLLGKKYHINDQNISGIGIIVNNKPKIEREELNILTKGGHIDNDDDELIDDDEIEIDEDEDDEDKEEDDDEIKKISLKDPEILAEESDDEIEIDEDEIDDEDEMNDEDEIDDDAF